MNIEIKQDKKNALLKRRDVGAEVRDYGSTPTRKGVAQAVAAKLGVGEERVLIRAVRQQYGKDAAMVEAKVYDDADGLKRYEQKYQVTRKEGKKKEGETDAKG